WSAGRSKLSIQEIAAPLGVVWPLSASRANFSLPCSSFQTKLSWYESVLTCELGGVPMICDGGVHMAMPQPWLESLSSPMEMTFLAGWPEFRLGPPMRSGPRPDSHMKLPVMPAACAAVSLWPMKKFMVRETLSSPVRAVDSPLVQSSVGSYNTVSEMSV